MIELKIVSKSEKKLKEISKILGEQSLVIDMNLTKAVERLKWENGKLRKTRIAILTAKTKALLFNRIDAALKKKYKDHMPELYSTPITYMDWEQSKKLTSIVVQV